ncbi:efflux RND transporter periplasmic adaptor subunit [Paradevosia shaoguanensis]|uniref:Efflux RND transporter periplasmic adaptor subunit n=1 Tax=Paradevosia shaoguanensis TaxID=1335043 RepID=A0AA41QJS2_9HYPH|nr:efflux RND transporter periplasmic adaptor subunit [Paradevosia shaoguanensis]MBI4046120.1 efflux RND transporter periplasmic adaptor subunit [Devosia nanyangense]QMV03252.1 efflux RND transporter periplasmic adaptor subunit [Devosia sp. D6-9]CDP51189.1 Macrolide-specific efflux protein MacA [Devosia sp. DBB001]MCF1741357.1 efflux RND transporter periplasmic adaptor subunit [Paradevosia shaoguanensis]MCI0125840.1 efflux RND transporter periplasmic adaptor subunit [Paradevosia shaoguanensis]
MAARNKAARSLFRWLIALVILAAVAAAGWYYYGRPKAAVIPPTVEVTRGDIQQTVLASGSLEASTVTSVGAQVSGRIETLHVKLGDEVKKGDLIAEIDSLDQTNAVKSAEAALANMRAQKEGRLSDLTQAQQTLTRTEQLLKQNLKSQADYDAANATVTATNAAITALEAQISQAELAVDSANLNLSRTKITSPVDGTVVAVLVTEGQTVSAAQQTPTIIKVANLDTMVIKAQISEADVTRVQPGQKATFTIMGEPDKQIDAVLRSIEPAPDAITTSDTGISSTDNAIYYNGRFEVQNPDHRLRIAMTAKVTIVLADEQNALILPSSALGTAGRDGKYRVRVLDPSTDEISVRQVTVGINNNVSAEIKDGLQEGDRVLALGAASAAASRQQGPGGGGRFRGPAVFGL